MLNETIQKEFQRKEIKYLIEADTLEQLQKEFKDYLTPDRFTHSSITNIYFDNPDFQLIKDSINHRHASEKIRMRTYDPKPTQKSQAFLEIKKKEYQGEQEIGYKYRLTSTPLSLCNYVQQGIIDNNIKQDDRANHELAILRERYKKLVPKMFIHYERFSLRGIENPKLRVTFDRNVIYRHENVNLTSGFNGYPLLKNNQIVMEVKVKNGLPAWMEKIFHKHQLIPQSFSKYTTAYLKAYGLTPEDIREEPTSIA